MTSLSQSANKVFGAWVLGESKMVGDAYIAHEPASLRGQICGPLFLLSTPQVRSTRVGYQAETPLRNSWVDRCPRSRVMIVSKQVSVCLLSPAFLFSPPLL